MMLVTLCLLAGLLLALLGEALARYLGPPSVVSPRLSLRPRRPLELHVDLRGVSPLARHSTNDWGLRGDPLPRPRDHHFTIVVIGESTAQNYYLDDHKTWTALLQRRLQQHVPAVWIGNGALDGQSTRSHLRFMEDIIPHMHPDAVILLLGVNDLGFSLSETRRRLGNPYERIGWQMKLYARSRLVQLLHRWMLAMSQRPAVVPRAGHVNYDPQPLTEPVMPLPDDLGALLPALPEYRRNIVELIRRGAAQRVRMLFLTQPMLFEDTPYWRTIEGVSYRSEGIKRKLSAATYWRLMDLYNQALRDVCRAHRADCFDLASAIPHNADYWYDPLHLTEAGAALTAAAVAAHIQGIGWLNGQATSSAPLVPAGLVRSSP